MQYTINQLYDRLLGKVNNIYGIFKGFFGESDVDLQPFVSQDYLKQRILRFLEASEGQAKGFDSDETYYEITDEALKDLEEELYDKRFIIYVHWSKVTITNEHNKSVNIQDLYAQIEIQLNGRIPYECYGFKLNRATYTPEQFDGNYMHSHVCDIPKGNFTNFQSPCLGTGPINNTIGTLKNEYDEVEWMLFCQELAMYVTVESLTGVPYHKLEHLGNGYKLEGYEDYDLSKGNIACFLRLFTKEDLTKFIKYYLEKGHLSLCFRNGNFTCGMPFYEYIVDISNSFIDYYNKYLVKTKARLTTCYNVGLLNKAILKGTRFYQDRMESYDPHKYDNFQGKKVLTFKGREVKLQILEPNSANSQPIIIISNNLAMYILRNILRTINFRYKNEHNNKQGGEQTPASACQRVFYL